MASNQIRCQSDTISLWVMSRILFFLSGQQSNVAMHAKTIDLSNGSGHENGNEDFKILGATEVNGELHFMFTRKDQDAPQIISNKDARIKYPQELMAFYESCMVRFSLLTLTVSCYIFEKQIRFLNFFFWIRKIRSKLMQCYFCFANRFGMYPKRKLMSMKWMALMANKTQILKN